MQRHRVFGVWGLQVAGNPGAVGGASVDLSEAVCLELKGLWVLSGEPGLAGASEQG